MRFRALGFRVLALLCVSWLAPLAQVEAQPARAPSELIAAYHAALDCPLQADFERSVRARIAQGAALARGRSFEVRFVSGPAGVRGTLRSVGLGGAGVRELTAASCAEAADALSLVAALMLGELAPAPKPAPEPLETRAPTAPESGAARATRSGARSGARERANAPPVALQPAVDAAETPDRTPPSEPTEGVPSQPAVSLPAPRAEAPRAALFSRAQLELRLAGLAAFRVAPHVRPGLALALELSAQTRAGPRLGLTLGLRASWPDRVRTAAGSARFSWLSSALAACVGSPLRRLRFAACGVLELGALMARGTASEAGHQSTRFWGALGPSLAGGLAFSERSGLRLSGELLGILVRDRFLLDQRPVFSVPRLAFRAELAFWITIL